MIYFTLFLYPAAVVIDCHLGLFACLLCCSFVDDDQVSQIFGCLVIVVVGYNINNSVTTTTTTTKF